MAELGRLTQPPYEPRACVPKFHEISQFAEFSQNFDEISEPVYKVAKISQPYLAVIV